MVRRIPLSEKAQVQPKTIPVRTQPIVNSSYNRLINAGLSWGTKKLKDALSVQALKKRLVNKTVGFGVNFGLSTGNVQGLTPVGDTGLYASPSFAPDVEDCVHYPTSMFCSSSNPLLGFAQGLANVTLTIVDGSCDFGVTLSGNLSFIRTPPLSLVYRRKECRPGHLDPYALSQRDDYEEAITIPGSYSDDDFVCVVLYCDYVYEKQERVVEVYPWQQVRYGLQDYENISKSEIESSASVNSFEYPYKGSKRFYDGHRYDTGQDIYREILAELNSSTSVRYRLNKSYGVNQGFADYEDSENYRIQGLYKPWDKDGDDYVGQGSYTSKQLAVYRPNDDGFYPLDFYCFLSAAPGYAVGDIPPHAKQVVEDDLWYGDPGLFYQGKYYNFTHVNNRNYTTGSGIFYIGSYGRIKPYFSQFKNSKTTVSNEYANGVRIVHCTCLINGIPTAPPPPTFYEDDDMACCNVTKANNKLLKELTEKVKKLSDIVGVDEYPASLPASLISKDEGWLGNLIPDQPESIPNLTQLLAKFIKYYDETTGQWEVGVQVKDSDPLTPGDQPVGIKLPNMAECLAEMFTLMFQTHINSETLLNMSMRTMLETGADKQQNFISYKLIQSICDYLGFKHKDKEAELSLLFTPEKTRYDQLLQESKVKVAVQEFDEKFGLEADLMKLRKVASILDSVYFRKLDPNGDIKKQVLDKLIDTKRNMDKVNDNESETDWETYLKQVEEGYGQVTGVKDATKPYGRDYSERPKIRDLTELNKEKE